MEMHSNRRISPVDDLLNGNVLHYDRLPAMIAIIIVLIIVIVLFIDVVLFVDVVLFPCIFLFLIGILHILFVDILCILLPFGLCKLRGNL